MPNNPPKDILDLFNLRNPMFVEKTALASVWKATSSDESFVALKLYHGPTMRNEDAGFELMEKLAGNGAAKLIARSTNAAVIEWLDGPSLGDLTRSGNDQEASSILVEIANEIHADSTEPILGLPTLDEWFGSLFDLKFDPQCPQATKEEMVAAQETARKLLVSQTDMVWLHGDLHHDNIRLGERGYCAFDAKGVVGERGFELANAFRNPNGAEELIRNPVRINYLADLWSSKFQVERSRLLKWATVKCALSISWRTKTSLKSDQDLDLLSIFHEISTQ